MDETKDSERKKGVRNATQNNSFLKCCICLCGGHNDGINKYEAEQKRTNEREENKLVILSLTLSVSLFFRILLL